mmetsp:Transcript_3177/g.6568  ORF Transcript_3177/g.6568 Transcript_3177/m.6568 type:complete len:287 (+) Transcript_3177:462-1322(+)
MGSNGGIVGRGICAGPTEGAAKGGIAGGGLGAGPTVGGDIGRCLGGRPFGGGAVPFSCRILFFSRWILSRRTLSPAFFFSFTLRATARVCHWRSDRSDGGVARIRSSACFFSRCRSAERSFFCCRCSSSLPSRSRSAVDHPGCCLACARLVRRRSARSRAREFFRRRRSSAVWVGGVPAASTWRRFLPRQLPSLSPPASVGGACWGTPGRSVATSLNDDDTAEEEDGTATGSGSTRRSTMPVNGFFAVCSCNVIFPTIRKSISSFRECLFPIQYVGKREIRREVFP